MWLGETLAILILTCCLGPRTQVEPLIAYLDKAATTLITVGSATLDPYQPMPIRDYHSEGEREIPRSAMFMRDLSSTYCRRFKGFRGQCTGDRAIAVLEGKMRSSVLYDSRIRGKGASGRPRLSSSASRSLSYGISGILQSILISLRKIDEIEKV